MGTVNSNNMYNFELANQMGTFSVQKIETIGSKLDNMVQGLLSLTDDHTPQYHLPRSANSTSFQRRRLANLAAAVQRKAALWTLCRHS